jgi:hypothetical protein
MKSNWYRQSIAENAMSRRTPRLTAASALRSDEHFICQRIEPMQGRTAHVVAPHDPPRKRAA